MFLFQTNYFFILVKEGHHPGDQTESLVFEEYA